MGCCQSADREPEDAPHARALPPPNDPANPAEPGAARQYSQAPLNQHPSASSSNNNNNNQARPNKPIRPPTPLQHSPPDVSAHQPPWTRAQLAREREIFFETRTSGDDEVWKALRVVCECLRRNDLGEAQAFLDALNLSCPEGRVAAGRGRNREKGGLFDELGVGYAIPAWVVTDPEDVVENGEEEGGAEGGRDAVASAAAAEQERREEKGKGRAEDVGELVRLRVRLSDRGTDIVVQVGTAQKVAVIVREVQARIGNRRLRLMYLGKTLDERKTLEQTNWTQGHVINGLVYLGDEESIVSSSKSGR